MEAVIWVHTCTLVLYGGMLAALSRLCTPMPERPTFFVQRVWLVGSQGRVANIGQNLQNIYAMLFDLAFGRPSLGIVMNMKMKVA